jgi:hypothetical protein
MKSTKKAKSRGLIVAADDLTVGDWYAVYGLKHDPEQPVEVAGMAFRILAVNLPFVVGRLASDPAHPVTFDTRYLAFMRVDDDYVMAQRQGREPA